MNKKIIGALIAVAVVAAAVFAAGCVGPTEGEQVTLLFGFTPNVGYAPFYAAAANGYYSEEGLDVSFQYSMEGGAGATKQVAADNVEFGYAGDNEVMMGRLQDMPVVSVQRIIQKNLFGIYSKEELDITKPEDLVDKKVALPGPAVTATTITKIILMQSGINFAQIEPLYVGAAVTGVISGGKMNEISASDYTTIGRTYLFTSDTMTNEHSDIATKFVRATQKGLEYAIEHPEGAVDGYIKYNPEAAEKRDLHLAIWKAMVERGFDRDTNGEPIFHLPSEDNWAEKQDQMFDVGAIDKKMDVSEFYTDEFVKGTFKVA
jgi:NitT/TauT family transport system substrate-binding protein